MTIAARLFASSPARPADATWEAIVDLLTQGRGGEVRDELMGVRGTAASLIADRAPEEAPITVTCDGPRTRIRCVYDEDAIDGSGVNEDALGFDPLKGDWAVSLPCTAEDLGWVQSSLASKSARVTARDLSSSAGETQKSTAGQAAGAFEVDVGGLLS